jgi:hypothetical protein
MRALIILAALLWPVPAGASFISRCVDCDAALAGCLENAWWRVDKDRCYAERADCEKQWFCQGRLNLARPNPWTTIIIPAR